MASASAMNDERHARTHALKKSKILAQKFCAKSPIVIVAPKTKAPTNPMISRYLLVLIAWVLVSGPWGAQAVLPSYRIVSLTGGLHRPSGSAAFKALPADIPTVAAAAPKKKNRLRAMLPILASAFCAAAIMYPVDLVRGLQMANAGMGLSTKELLGNFHKAHGMKGFFTQGLAPELARSTWMRFIKFALFPLVHQAVFHRPDNKGTGATKAITAILSSIPEAVSIMPLELSKIALVLDTANVYKNDMFKAMGSLYRQHGLGIFTVGYMGVQYRQAAWSAGYFASLSFFETQVRGLLTQLRCDQNSPMAKMSAQVLSGFCAGVFGALFNTPGDTLRSTLQKKVLQGAPGHVSLLSVGQDIVKARGVPGLYAGFQFKAFHLGGGGALMAVLMPFFTKVFAEKD